MVTAVIGVLLGWIVGLRIAAEWEVRKKRTEINLQVTQELNKVIVEFKAIGRERDVLKSIALGATATQQDEIQKSRFALASRAIAAESGLEAILLEMLGGMEAALASMSPTQVESERARQIRVMGLTRVAFRRLRELLVDGNLDAPGYGETAVWLFNRLAADLTSIIITRATLPSFWRPWISGATPSLTASYLNVIAYRTVDLQMAEAAMRAAGEAYQMQRDQARRPEWLQNVRQFMPADRIVLFESQRDLADRKLVGDDDLSRPVIVHVADRATDAAVTEVAKVFFDERPALRWYVALIGGGARIMVQPREAAMQTLQEANSFPEDLLVDAGIPQAKGTLALRLLGWHQANAASAAITKMAQVNLGPI